MTLAQADGNGARDAKRLLRVSRTGALATLDREGPLTTLIGVASDWDGSPLFLVSDLARHARNLAADDRVSLLLVSDSPKGDPLNNPRVTLNGRVLRCDDPKARQRYVRRNPKAKLYVDFADFSLRRLEIESVHFNGGFGRAEKVSVSDLLTHPGDFSALAAAEDILLAEVEELLKDADLQRISGDAAPSRQWRPVGIDAEGFDLSSGGKSARVDFPAPFSDPTAWRNALERRLKR